MLHSILLRYIQITTHVMTQMPATTTGTAADRSTKLLQDKAGTHACAGGYRYDAGLQVQREPE